MKRVGKEEEEENHLTKIILIFLMDAHYLESQKKKEKNV